ncbi:hypothetical protein NDU88_004677 [Pleurodeles waltl]|uniref:Uncharacterized protein n=1 Tax=Pleurodeles waltl TaxID=8319 RepID=A0AAV7T8T6_PLEWA|nr:hypothetical protein NDU88_004677 [Pleurodeles waltl]
MEERIVAVEEDVVNLKEQNTMRDEQLTDVMWKLEDFENRQRRNNLRILGIPEGLEGSNIQTLESIRMLFSGPEFCSECDRELEPEGSEAAP